MSVPGYAPWSVTAGEQPTTAYWNILGSNDAAFNTFLTNSPVAFTGSVATLNGNPMWEYLGHAQITTNFSTSTSGNVAIPGLSITVTIPTGATAVRVSAFGSDVNSGTTGNYVNLSLWEGSVGTGTQISRAQHDVSQAQLCPVAILPSPTSGSTTFSVGINNGGSGTILLEASGEWPAFILVESC